MFMKTVLLRFLGSIGIFIFLPLLILTFVNPHKIEKSATSFIKHQLSKEVNKKIDNFHLPKTKKNSKFSELLKSKAGSMLQKTEHKLLLYKTALKNEVPKLIASQIAKVSNLDCECRKKWRDYLRDELKFQLLSLNKAKERLKLFIQAKYMDILTQLIKDLRVFFGTNLLVFVTILLVSFFKPKTINHLFLPAILIFISTIIVAFFYIFEQNWLYTIIYNDYVGYGYFVYIAVVFAILLDIIFNRARVTTEILNIFLQSINYLPIPSC